MLRIGLTGGLASGKSTVGALLAGHGAAVFDADRIVGELYRPGAVGESVARELFGAAVEDEQGRVDRSRIARLIFDDAVARRLLEARIHPLVREEIDRRFRDAEKRGFPVAVAEASQLLESATEDRYDRVLLVVAPESERIRRWSGKGGDAADARRRIAAQISPEEALSRVTDVIVNDGSLADLEEKVAEVYQRWTGVASEA